MEGSINFEILKFWVLTSFHTALDSAVFVDSSPKGSPLSDASRDSPSFLLITMLLWSLLILASKAGGKIAWKIAEDALWSS